MRHPERLALAALALLAVSLRLAWVHASLLLSFVREPVLDARYYHDWALALVRGETGPVVYYMSPLYAWFLAAVYQLAGPDPLWPRLLQAALGGVTTLLVALAARSLGGAVAAVAAAALWALLGTSIFYDGVLLGASLATLLAAALGLALQRAAMTIAGGAVAALLLGLLTLERPNALLLAPLLLLAVGSASPRSQRLRTIATTTFVLALTLLPACLHNWRGGDIALISTNAGTNLYIGNHRSATGIYGGVPGWPDEPAEQAVVAQRQAEKALGARLRPSEVSRFWSRRAWQELRSDPRRALRLWQAKLLALFNAREVQLNFNYEFVRSQVGAERLPLIGFGLILPLAVLGLGATLAKRESRLLAALSLTYLATVLPFFIAGRFRMPAMPWLVSLAGAGLAACASAVRERRFRALALPLVAAALALAVTRIPGLRQDHAASWNLVGSLAEQDGREAEAERAYRQALAQRPEFVPAALNLAAVLGRHGRRDEQEQLLRPLAGQAAPARELGRLLIERGQAEEAVRVLEHSTRVQDDVADSWNLLGVAMATAGNPTSARAAFRRALDCDPQFEPASRNLARIEALAAAPIPAPPIDREPVSP